jgi:hypothetical protein
MSTNDSTAMDLSSTVAAGVATERSGAAVSRDSQNSSATKYASAGGDHNDGPVETTPQVSGGFPALTGS